MIRKVIQLRSNIGLQSKLLAEFIQKASNYKSNIWLEKDEKRANAKSMLGILALGINERADVTLIAEGEDEEKAIKELEEFMGLNA